MQEIYYVDRPSIPVTQQNIIHLDAVTEHSIFIDAEDINGSYCAHAVEVRNSEGEIDGTLLYFPGVTHAQLTSVPSTLEDAVNEEEEILEEESSEGVEEGDLSDTVQTPQTADEFNRESELIDLELALAEATQAVQEIEDQIAAIEKESSID